MTWTQAVCPERWNTMHPDRLIDPTDPHWAPNEMSEPCCYCKRPSSIFIRIDPTTVPFPRED